MQSESSTGSSTSNRVRTTLTIRIENIDFDTQACVLRLKGRNIAENQYVKVRIRIYVLGMVLAQFCHLKIKVIFCHMFQMGAYHTLDLEVNRKFTLAKSEWDSVALERVDTACDPTQV